MQTLRHAYLSDGTYYGAVVAADDQWASFAATEGLTAGDAPEEAASDPRDDIALPRADFAMNAAEMAPDIVSWEEAEGWAAGQALPAVAIDYIETLPEEDRARERIALRARQTVRRTHPAIVAIGKKRNLTPEQIDVLFTPRSDTTT